MYITYLHSYTPLYEHCKNVKASFKYLLFVCNGHIPNVLIKDDVAFRIDCLFIRIFGGID